jgi:uncharacterized oligopeptide transporter (OPT) family protein
MSSDDAPGEGHVHAGHKPPGAREFTLRAAIAAILVAALMGASYPYIVLRIGFGPNVSVVAAFFGFLALGIIFRDFTRFENNIVQTAGTSAAQTAFMCVLLAAFDMLKARNPSFHTSLTPLQSFAWLTAAGVLGVLMAIPLRRHFIVDEKLPFADGIAAGETLMVLDARGAASRKAVGAMAIGTLSSGAFMIAREDGVVLPALKRWAVPEGMKFGSELVQKMGVGLTYSLLNIGSGMLVGLRINVSMLIGGILSWVIAPYLTTGHGWVHAHPGRNDVLAWVMWPATGMLVVGGLTALALRWNVLVRTFKSLAGAKMSGEEIPLKVVGAGVAVASLALIVIQKLSLGLPIWMTVLAILLSAPLMLVGLRVLGETNWGPISALSNMMQGLFAFIAPGQMAPNMLASGTTGTIATSSEAIMQDYKAGYMIGSTPRLLAYAQLAAVPIGAAAVSWIYPYLRDTYGIVGEHARLTSPISAKWAMFADLLRGGASAVPTGALPALAIFAVLGVLFTVLEDKREWRAFVPSPTGIGIGMLVPFNVVATMFVGGLIGYLWDRADKKSSDAYQVPLSSGLIAGEAIVAVVVPILIAAKLLPSPQ